MVDIPTISIVIASAGVLAGVIYYILEIRHQSKLRQTESLFKLSPWFNINAKEMQEAISQTCSIEYENYDDYLKKYADRPEHMMLKTIGNYFEGIGILVQRKLVNTDVVRDFWGSIIVSTWEQIEPIISDMRKDSDDPQMFKFWEYLYHEMKKKR